MMLLFCDEGFSTDWEACLHSQRVCTKCHNGNMWKKITQTQSQDEKNTLSFDH